jgi:non-specific serine/threonine protein kinase
VVAKLCTRLDGLPLAIELAAAHIGALPPQVQLERLVRRLKLPMRGSRDAPARQQTLHNTIAWSHDLLNVQERELFRRLAVFEGGVSLAAVEAVCWGDGLVPRHVLECLVALVDKNLLHAHDQPTPRYRMLETVREYAQEQLGASGEEELVRRRHADYFVTLAETGEMALIGGPAQAEWFLRLDTEQDNLRSALRWACSGADTNVGLRLAGAIGYFWLMSGRLAEGQEWLMGALGVARSATPVLRSKALTLAAHIALLQGNLVLAQELSDAATPLANASGSPMERVRSLMVRALLERAREQHAHALELLDSATAELRGLGVEPPGIVRYQQANTMLRLGNIEQASSLHEATLADVLASGDKYMAAAVLADLGCIALFRADPEQALRRFRTAFTFACEVSELLAMAGCIEAIAQVHCRSKNYQMAVTLLGAADRICDLASVPPPGSDAFERMRWLPRGLSAPRLIESAREALGETAFDAAWAHGRALPPAQVTAYILPTQDVEPAPAGAVLTAREREVATLLARGLSNRQLAEHLVITTRTVENHLSHILDKLDLSSRTQIATWAMEHLIPRRGEGASGGAHDHARGRA